MKYHQILTALTREPLLIMPASAASLFQLFSEHATLDSDQFRAAREGIGMCGETVDLAQMEIEDGIATIPVGGPIGAGLGKFEKGAGAVDVADISSELDAAEESDEVNGIILHFDSPGGMVSGIPELSDKIASINKPVWSFTEGTMASAAYWLASATDNIFATKSSDVGSIGVYLPWIDSTEALAMKGVSVKLFTSGKYKGMGFPGTQLTADQEALLQSRVMDIANSFYSQVKSTRGDVADETMQGQSFSGVQAVQCGLVDCTVQDMQEVRDLMGESKTFKAMAR